MSNAISDSEGIVDHNFRNIDLRNPSVDQADKQL